MATNAAQEHQILSPNEKKVKPPRGILSFIVSDSLLMSVYEECKNARQISLAAGGLSKRARRRYRREIGRTVNNNGNESNISGHDPCDNPSLYSLDTPNTRAVENSVALSRQYYDHNKSEFTLLFFCAPYCHHSLRFLPQLAHFVHSQNERYNGSSSLGRGQTNKCTIAMQCICIPDCSSGIEAKKMLDGTGFYYFPQCHLDPSYTSIKALTQIHSIPTVLVVDNVKGNVVTNWGRTAIEFNGDGCIDAWRMGQPGVSLFWRLLSVI